MEEDSYAVEGALAAGYPGGQTATEEHTGGSWYEWFIWKNRCTTITGDVTPIINKLPFPPGLVSGSGILALISVVRLTKDLD